MVWRRLPTFFPNFPLRMMPVSEAQAAQIRETGWVREAAFRTEPHVNKVRERRVFSLICVRLSSSRRDTTPPPHQQPPPPLTPTTPTTQHTQPPQPSTLQKTTPQVEIKRFLETVYGARVERVATLNYEGKKKRRLDPKTGRPKWVRLPDWKKAYVTFRAPAAAATGVEAAASQAAASAGEAARRAAEQEQESARRRAGGGDGGRWGMLPSGGLGRGLPGRLAERWPKVVVAGERR
jgi:ribosomal protein L23